MALFNLPHPGGLIAEYPEDTDIRLRSLVRQLAFRRIAAKVASVKAASLIQTFYLITAAAHYPVTHPAHEHHDCKKR